MLPHLLNNFEIQKYDQNEPKYNGASWRSILSKIEYGEFVINLDE